METLKKFIDFGLEVLRTAHVVTKWTVCKILFIKIGRASCRERV